VLQFKFRVPGLLRTSMARHDMAAVRRGGAWLNFLSPNRHDAGQATEDTMTASTTASRRKLMLASFSASALAMLLRPARALAQAVRPMAEHPFARANYIPGAPPRAKVGSGKVIRGQVVSSADGRPIRDAKVEYYLNTTPNAGGIGEQNPANRGQVVTDADGRFTFESDPPQSVFANAEPHIHTRATAGGHQEFYYRHLTPSEPSEDDVTIVLAGA